MRMTGRNNKCSFSIDHILNVAGNVPQSTNLNLLHYDWLDCTRYRPPRIQRPKKREGVQRRNAGRNPRIPFSPSQVSLLETKFQTTPYLSSHEVQQIANQLQLSEVRVKIWFQNRRARERRDQEPQNQSKLKDDNTTKNSRISPVLENKPQLSNSIVQPRKFEIFKEELPSKCVSLASIKGMNYENPDVLSHYAKSLKNNSIIR